MIGSTVTNYLLLSTLLLLYLGCGTPSEQTNKSVIGPDVPEPKTEESIPVISAPTLPKGALIADFNGDGIPFYSHVKKVDRNTGVTLIAFENDRYPAIRLPEIYGASIRIINLEGFQKDLLLVNATLKDPNFTKYFLYVLKNGQWKAVTNGFSIHNSHLTDTLTPIRNHPEDPNLLIRHYSVFDLDETSKLGYTWRLLEETVPIENR